MNKTTIKAGDIILTRSDTASSKIIRYLTGSKWSHVGIAVDEFNILEAVPAGKSGIDSTPDVRVIPISEFKEGKSAALHFSRPGHMTHNQLTKLKDFSISKIGKKYTLMHAGLTTFSPLVKYIFFIIAICSMVDVFLLSTPGHWTTSILASMSVGAIVLFFWFIMDRSIKSEWGIEWTENFFRKFSAGNWLVEQKHQFSCSKLVLMVDTEIGGHLHLHSPGKYDVQPGHIAKACKNMNWAHTPLVVSKD
ncbi:hypothetical protein PQR14_23325 [Paraburkholderia bryophila]|uniref:hypothetical protein n=1 Tax=Burkholderiaceae TaxID=119060 RepID=UPI0009DF771D|nr:hypothetical protein [Burkholderia sp. 9120]